ncbi:Bifunctional homocysteine S-methyltransferase/5,10-methylenetetrahydrofolate reductase [Aquisphaera giovannonii]|uniref:Bifunctional homocysteine S-methyltransferase/5,10-methylenetetrahydrofolate reductase n=1 Tax=Aquisphaera giovannonii TaxID=406548 RepID=A0A5B9WCT6_9BACT|nr:homocysteine S-methyltransferase family protein [Aquisphaera giovannonii]QEH37690.1 Bifunctional homocysteine S-methyltransferase/5,10-methylenetetrahydrofolate reductase [Aquisphaera giovannonii]
MSRLRELFGGQEVVLTDGAWGTELQGRGLAMGRPGDPWNLERPADVLAVARAYVGAGSRVILTNTFRANAVALAAIGLEGRVGEINRRGAQISREAAAARPGVRVFGSMGPTGKVLATGEIGPEAVSSAFDEQAKALAAGGVDALLFETFSEIEEARLAVRAARAAGLPIVVSFAFWRGEERDRTMTGASPEDAGAAMAEEGADAVGANCGEGPEAFPGVCRRLKASSGLPVWIKPNAGLPSLREGRAVYAMTPEEFGGHAASIVDAGANFLGGCCGTSPEFIRALAGMLESCASE